MSSRRSDKEHKEALAAAAADYPSQTSSELNFIRHTVGAITAEDSAKYENDELLAMVASSFANLNIRQAKPFSVTFRPAEDTANHAPEILDIFTADMPFVVDSVLAAIRATGGTIRAFAHPILPVDTQTGELIVLENGGAGIRRESFLHIHLDPLPSEERREAIHLEITEVLNQVRAAVRGWRPMLERLKSLVSTYRQSPPDVPAASLAEGLHFLAWLADHNFTFLGMREYRLIGEGNAARLEPTNPVGLGILEDPNLLFLRDGHDYVEMTEQHISFLQTSAPLLVTKANIQSKVHRRAHMDYVGVKLYGEDGRLSGELRVLGLFTSMSLTTPHSEVPLIRRKVSDVMRRSGLNPQSHDGKALMAALDSFPRDEMFQITESDLFDFATLMAALPDRPQVRVLPRVDRFDNFVSILLFIPRDTYDSELRKQIGEYLAEQYDGRVSAYYPHFPEGELVRVHFIIGRNGGQTPRPRRQDMESKISHMLRRFSDRLAEIAPNPALIEDYADAFSPGYQATHSEQDALQDIEAAAQLSVEGDIATHFAPAAKDGQFLLKFYHLNSAVPLSKRVPLLENFGFDVIDERSHIFERKNALNVHLNEMRIRFSADQSFDTTKTAARLDAAIRAIWNNHAESDGLNQLVVGAGLDWASVGLVRSWSRYLRQINVAYSQRYIAGVMNSHADLTAKLVELFSTLHDPDYSGDRDAHAKSLVSDISASLEQISSIDQDRILRHMLNLVQSALRTNYFQRDESGARKPALATKYDSALIEGLPAPRPYREIHVYAPRVEGIHLRGGPISRGGLRWSDRPEDFRTEILGLVKAQMTKNAVIVPVGAKGGFVPKQMPTDPDRDTFIAEGTACYKIFINTLLDVTDNLDGDMVLPPEMVTRRDGDDPYLVVAADKGTATFSDTANAISQSRDFWLDDAFASGGSAGYDHKKMGITARGAWEAVKRHFREMDRDIQSSAFTAVGVGDMSGDVFGNGMLLSRETKLIAAFDHRDIFVDPNPDAYSTYAERQRLFDMGRSSWKDYDESLISEGGGIFSRSAKTISVTPEMKQALNILSDHLTPNQLINAILKSPVDLLWFGGIGTYVRSSSETDAEAGDRANDAIRITASEVGAKVIGEGANLGITQLGRMEFAQHGGRVNTDAIDNSAGVNSSDLEVNIKIALGTLVRANEMSVDQRNIFLEQMTDQVADLCLRNNYLQTLTLSLAERRGTDAVPDLMGLMQSLESAGHLDRPVEFLPDDAEITERLSAGKALTRPEMAILLAYAKNTLFDDLLASNVPDDPYLSKELYRYFPDDLTRRYPETVDGHRLRREVIATVLSNAMINRGGPEFISKLSKATSATAGDIAFAYAAARDSFDLPTLNVNVDDLDNKVTGDVQLGLYGEIQTLMVDQTVWFQRNVSFEQGLAPVVETYAKGIEQIRAALPELVTPFVAKSIADQAEGFIAGGAPEPLAKRIAELSALTLATDIVFLAQDQNEDVLLTARAFFAVLEQFNLGRITELSRYMELSDRFDRMALDRALANLSRAMRDLTEDVLSSSGDSVPERHANWNETYKNEITRIHKMVTDLTEGELTVSRLSVAAGLLSDLARH